MFSHSGLHGASCVFLSGESVTADLLHQFQPNSAQDKDQQVHVVRCAQEGEGRSLLCTIASFCGWFPRTVSENEGPNSSRATYSVLLEKMASRDGRCVSALKQRRVDPSNDGRPSSTSTRRPSTTRADCLEEWELPCGRPSAPGPASALNGPPGRMHNVSLYRPNMSAVDAEIDDIRRTVLSVINNTVSSSALLGLIVV